MVEADPYGGDLALRLRPDGNAQYLQLKGQLAHYLDDPYTEVVEREPLRDHVTFTFIGGGFAGAPMLLLHSTGAKTGWGVPARTNRCGQRRTAMRWAQEIARNPQRPARWKKCPRRNAPCVAIRSPSFHT